MTLNTIDKIKSMKRQIEQYINLKVYIIFILFWAIVFFFIGDIVTAYIFLIIAVIGLLFHDQLKNEIWINKK